jgi:FAD/FMN-containing dehydrogenase
MKGPIRTRRAFIQQSAMAGMLAFLNGCGQAGTSLNATLNTGVLNKFRESINGRTLIPGETGYDTSRIVPAMNQETDKYPAIIVQCKNEQDILRSIDFAHQHNLEVAVRSGNHSFLGWGTCEKGMVIDLSKLKAIKIDPTKKTAEVGTGNTAEEILAATAAYGLAPILGQCGTVGSGIALGGGLGWLSGRFGATCDNLLSARIITSGAKTITADTNNNEDLYWAIRGGGGNFGIATSFQYQLHPVAEMLEGSFAYPVSKSGIMLRHFRDFMANAPDELQGDFNILSSGRPYCSTQFVYTGNLEEGKKLIDTFRKFEAPERDTMKRKLFSDVYVMDENDASVSCPFQSAKGSYLEQLSDDVIDYVIDRFAEAPPFCELGFDFSHYMHGQVCRVAPDATAFVHRTAGAVHLASWIAWKEDPNAEKCISWHTTTFDRLQSFSGGHVYANYMSSKGKDTVKKVYAGNYSRLVQVKKKFDPDNFLHLNQNIEV